MPRKNSKKKSSRAATRGVARPAEGLSVSELTAELNRRRRAVVSLHRRRDRIRAQIEALNAEIAALGGSSGMTASGRARNSQSLADALHAALSGKEAGVTQAAERVQSAGYVSTAANFTTMVNQVLLRDKRFKKVSRGVYIAK